MYSVGFVTFNRVLTCHGLNNLWYILGQIFSGATLHRFVFAPITGHQIETRGPYSDVGTAEVLQ